MGEASSIAAGKSRGKGASFMLSRKGETGAYHEETVPAHVSPWLEDASMRKIVVKNGGRFIQNAGFINKEQYLSRTALRLTGY